MPNRKKSGNSHIRQQKNLSKINANSTTPFPEEEQFVAIVVSELGDRRFNIVDTFGSSSIAHVRGSLSKKKCFIRVNDVILASSRSFEDNKSDILHKYSSSDIRQLLKHAIIDSSFLNRIKKPLSTSHFDEPDDINITQSSFDDVFI